MKLNDPTLLGWIISAGGAIVGAVGGAIGDTAGSLGGAVGDAAKGLGGALSAGASQQERATTAIAAAPKDSGTKTGGLPNWAMASLVLGGLVLVVAIGIALTRR